MEGDDDALSTSRLLEILVCVQAIVLGMVGPARVNSKYPPLLKVTQVNGGKLRVKDLLFKDLTPIFPRSASYWNTVDSITGCAIDLVAPIGRGPAWFDCRLKGR